MAAPQSTSINALAITPDLRFWMTGGSDGYIRKYDGVGTINGKQLLTVAQRHPFVDSVTKAGILMSYWENEEPSPPNARVEEHVLSPVYSLAVHSQALWLLSGVDSGGINLQSVRRDEGKRIVCLREGHTNAVSVLMLAPDERSVLSGSWDKNILDWDLNTGQIIRRFEGGEGQISALELRPASGAPIPAAASEVYIKSDTHLLVTTTSPYSAASFTEEHGWCGRHVDRCREWRPEQAVSLEHASHSSAAPRGRYSATTMAWVAGAFGDDDDEFSRAMEMTLNDEPAQPTVDQSGDFPWQMPTQPPPRQSQLPPQRFSLLARMDPASPPPQRLTGLVVLTTPSSRSRPTPQTLAHSSCPRSRTASSTRSQSRSRCQRWTRRRCTRNPALRRCCSLQLCHHPISDATQTSSSTFLSAAINGTIRIWDRRVQNPVARINNRPGVPPWCMGACWSPDGNKIFAGRRNGTVEEFDIHSAWSGWSSERTLKFPGGSGAVSCVRPMPNGKHLVCASHDILRLHDLQETSSSKGKVPFLIIPGPPAPWRHLEPLHRSNIQSS